MNFLITRKIQEGKFSIHSLILYASISSDGVNAHTAPEQNKKRCKLSYIDGISRCVMPQPDSVAWNTQHRRKGSEPTETVGPPGELVVQVFNRCEFDDVEDEDALER